MPKLWDDTIEAHRRAVHEAVVKVTASLVANGGLTSVSMAQVAKEAGIGRATLYKYFPDLASILRAWHEQTVQGHLEALTEARDRPGSPTDRLTSVLTTYAGLVREHPTPNGVVAFLHRGPHVEKAHHQLQSFIHSLIAEGQRAGEIRQDCSPDELASYCLHALAAAASARSAVALRRLVNVTLAGLRLT